MKTFLKFLKMISIIAFLILSIVLAKPSSEEANKHFNESPRMVQAFENKNTLEAMGDKYRNYFDSCQMRYNDKSFGVYCTKKCIFTSYEFLSTNTNNENTTFYTNYNIEDNIFTLTINDAYNSAQSIYGSLEYDAELEDYFLVNIDSANDKVSIRDLVEYGISDEKCILSKDIHFENIIDCGGGTAAAVTFILLAPKIVESVDTALNMIGRALSSFWNWFCGLFAPKTQTKVYAFEFNGVTYQTQAMSKADVESLEDNTYYLCVADKALGCFFFTTISVDYETAVLALESARFVTCLSGSGNSYILSTWTRKSSDAEQLARDASAAWGYYQSAHWHNFEEQAPVFMEHWHPGPHYEDEKTPHSFFGAPTC